MQKQVMIDIETLGTGPDAVILSIGATEFTLEQGVDYTEEYYPLTLYKRIKANSQPNRKIDADTVDWWMRQSSEAQKALYDGEQCTLEIGLKALGIFLDHWDNPIVWANGVAFDIAILDHAYRQLGMKSPWRYSNVSCMRTLRNLVPSWVADSVHPIGDAHNAINDAQWQANYVAAALKYLRETIKDRANAQEA